MTYWFIHYFRTNISWNCTTGAIFNIVLYPNQLVFRTKTGHVFLMHVFLPIWTPISSGPLWLSRSVSALARSYVAPLVILVRGPITATPAMIPHMMIRRCNQNNFLGLAVSVELIFDYFKRIFFPLFFRQHQLCFNSKIELMLCLHFVWIQINFCLQLK